MKVGNVNYTLVLHYDLKNSMLFRWNARFYKKKKKIIHVEPSEFSKRPSCGVVTLDFFFLDLYFQRIWREDL